MNGRKTTPRVRGTRPNLEAAAIELRRHATSAESVLWEALRDRQAGGLKFRRQHPVGPFVVDFYCASCKLVVELDGGIHDEQVAQDIARTQHLNGFGYRVLRFTNDAVFHNRDGVLKTIAAATQS